MTKHVFDDILLDTMSILKVLTIAIVTIFLFSSVGFCTETNLEDQESHYCIVNCSSCDQRALTQSKEFLTIAFSPNSDLVFLKEISYQDLFIRNIDHPPEVSL